MERARHRLLRSFGHQFSQRSKPRCATDFWVLNIVLRLGCSQWGGGSWEARPEGRWISCCVIFRVWENLAELVGGDGAAMGRESGVSERGDLGVVGVEDLRRWRCDPAPVEGRPDSSVGLGSRVGECAHSVGSMSESDDRESQNRQPCLEFPVQDFLGSGN